jgi:hypothetical protein
MKIVIPIPMVARLDACLAGFAATGLEALTFWLEVDCLVAEVLEVGVVVLVVGVTVLVAPVFLAGLTLPPDPLDDPLLIVFPVPPLEAGAQVGVS